MMKRVQFPIFHFDHWLRSDEGKPKVCDDKLNKIRKLGTNPRRSIQQLRVSQLHGLRKKSVKILVRRRIAYIRRSGFKQPGTHRREK